jgi:rhamnogalacturonan endolyase
MRLSTLVRRCVPAIALAACAAVSRPAHAQAPVTLTEDAQGYTLANGIVTARILKAGGSLLSLKYKGIETMDTSGRAGGYWSHRPGGARTIDEITINPTANGGDRAEVSIKGIAGGQSQGAGPGGGVIADIEVRYCLGRGVSGLYTYSIFDHRPEYAATGIGEARFLTKLNDAVFDWMTVDSRRNREMITASDWDHGTRLNMKEARRMTTGKFTGEAEHKYDYSAVQFDCPAFGWSSTREHIGCYLVNPTTEYLSGGATKLELMTHRDATFTDNLVAPAPPVTLNYWRGSHYGGSECTMSAGEAWTKVIGPFLIYCNSGPTPDAMWHDALARAGDEAKLWPYDWVNGVDYPHRAERGTVSGRIDLRDPQAPGAPLTNLRIGLAHPDYVTPGASPRAADGGRVDWQKDAKYYEFWVRAGADGAFKIPNVRAGKYTLHAIADGVLGEFAKADITVEPGKSLDLGPLTWTPVRDGRQLWDIGVPDRSAGEFLHGDKYYQWGLYTLYPKDFPNDVHYTVGVSDFRKDWNYAQVPRSDDPNGRGSGPANTWTIAFTLPAAPHGKATLRIALAGSTARHIAVGVNGQPAGDIGPLEDTATIRRDAIGAYWREEAVVFDAALMKAGANTLTLTIPAGNEMSGIEYDYLRLELDENAGR